MTPAQTDTRKADNAIPAQGDDIARYARPIDAVNWIDSILANNRNWRLGILALLSLQLVLVLSHRAWLDEWQALQIAVSSPEIDVLLANLRYEGHPPLWYLILQAVAIFVPFLLVLKATLLPIALLTQTTILIRAPFTRGERLLLSSGALILFEYLTLSRSLALGVMMLVITMAFWRDRRLPWATISALPMCDFLFGILSLIAVLGRLKDRLTWTPGIILWGLSGLFAAWSVMPAPDMTPALSGSPAQSLVLAMQYIGTALLPLQATDLHLQWNTQLPYGLGLLTFPIFLWFGYRQTREDNVSFFAFAGFITVLLLFSVFIYPMQFRHISLVALLLVLLRWRMALAGAVLDRWFRLWLFTGAICGLIVSVHALRTPFDRAPDVAKWIVGHGLADERWIVFPESQAQGVSAISGIHFERLDQRCRQTFVRWNQNDPIDSQKKLNQALAKFIEDSGRGYLLSAWPLDDLPESLSKRIARFDGGYNGQDYYLFLVGPSAPDRASRAPYCHSSQALTTSADGV